MKSGNSSSSTIIWFFIGLVLATCWNACMQFRSVLYFSAHQLLCWSFIGSYWALWAILLKNLNIPLGFPLIIIPHFNKFIASKHLLKVRRHEINICSECQVFHHNRVSLANIWIKYLVIMLQWNNRDSEQIFMVCGKFVLGIWLLVLQHFA